MSDLFVNIATIFFYFCVFWISCMISWFLAYVFLYDNIPNHYYKMIYFLILPYVIYLIIKKINKQ